MAAVAEEAVVVAEEAVAVAVSAVGAAVGVEVVSVAAAIRVRRLAALRLLAVPRQGRPIAPAVLAPAVPRRDPAREHDPVLADGQVTQ